MKTTFHGRPVPNVWGYLLVAVAVPALLVAFAVLVVAAPFCALGRALRRRWLRRTIKIGDVNLYRLERRVAAMRQGGWAIVHPIAASWSGYWARMAPPADHRPCPHGHRDWDDCPVCCH